MAYGDGVAAIIGQFFGKHPYTIFKGHKTLEGSFAMFITSMLVIGIYQLFVYQSFNWMHIGSLALVATLVEAISPHGIDNLFIPMLVSLLYFILIL
jgi:phytol kinase